MHGRKNREWVDNHCTESTTQCKPGCRYTFWLDHKEPRLLYCFRFPLFCGGILEYWFSMGVDDCKNRKHHPVLITRVKKWGTINIKIPENSHFMWKEEELSSLRYRLPYDPLDYDRLWTLYEYVSPNGRTCTVMVLFLNGISEWKVGSGVSLCVPHPTTSLRVCTLVLYLCMSTYGDSENPNKQYLVFDWLCYTIGSSVFTYKEEQTVITLGSLIIEQQFHR